MLNIMELIELFVIGVVIAAAGIVAVVIAALPFVIVIFATAYAVKLAGCS